MEKNDLKQVYVAPNVKVFLYDAQDVVRVSEVTPSWRWDDGNGDYYVSESKRGGNL